MLKTQIRCREDVILWEEREEIRKAHDREEVKDSKRGRGDHREKMGKADRGRRLSTPISVSSSTGSQCHLGLLQQSPALK